MADPIVYIAAPLSAPTRAGVERNRARAARWTAWAATQGCAPVATWIVLTGVWNDADQHQRARGLAIDCRLVERCDAVLLVGGGVSEGMRVESAHAREHGLPVLDLTDLGEEPPQFEFPLEQRVRQVIAQGILDRRRRG